MDEGRRVNVAPSSPSGKANTATLAPTAALDATGKPRFHRPVRIIAGEFKSRRIQPPPDAATTRPIPDRVKEAMFNLLRGHVEGQSVVDAFAGTGSIGLEAISRGAAECVFFERERKMADTIRANVASLGVEDRSRVIHADALGSSALVRIPKPTHLIFFDPPYRMVTEPESRRRVLDQLGRFIGLLDEDGYAVLRTPWPLHEKARYEEGEHRTDADLHIEGAAGPETHEYGSMALHLYMRDIQPDSPSPT